MSSLLLISNNELQRGRNYINFFFDDLGIVTCNLTIGLKNFSKRGRASDVVSEDMESNLNSDKNVNDEKLTLG